MFGILFYDILFFAIPIILIVLFGINLYRYISAVKANKKEPGTFSPKQIKNRLIILIITSVVLAIFLAIVLGFMALMFMAIAYM